MQKRKQTLSPIGEVITAERKALGIRVVDFCREAHISRKTTTSCLKETPFRDGTHQTPALHEGVSYSARVA